VKQRHASKGRERSPMFSYPRFIVGLVTANGRPYEVSDAVNVILYHHHADVRAPVG
jgi:hypothetical protein